MHKKYHEKFKILGIFAVTTQAREGIETCGVNNSYGHPDVTTQAREGIETIGVIDGFGWEKVTTQAREGIETNIYEIDLENVARNNSSPRGH